jgi:hypothetical protein
MMIKRATKVELEGRGILTLNPNDHIATGGEGSVYRKGDTIIKLYSDPDKMVRDGMPKKIKLLSALQHDYIVAPRGLVLDAQGMPIGYYMSYAEGEPLSRVFTNDFRRLQGFTDADASKLAERMLQTFQFAHDRKINLVDPNELNWLALLTTKHDPKPQALDVDAWVIDGQVPAKVPKMLSIRDWHGKLVSRESDWFAWGVVTFQIYTGIHPYKGTLEGYKLSELERRMRDNTSVFTPGVRLNLAVREFSCIPQKLLRWYENTFQHCLRDIPPSPFDTTAGVPKAVQVLRAVITSSGMLTYEKLFGDAKDAAIRVYPCGVILLQSGRLIDLVTKREIGKVTSPECEIVKINGYWLKADKVDNSLTFSCIHTTNLLEQSLELNAAGKHLVRYDNRLFLVTEQGLTELQLRILGRPILSTGQTWGVMINSTRWFDGVGIQDTMGATFVVAPFSDNSVAQVRVRELDGLRPVAAKAGNRFITVIVVDRNGQYAKVDLTFDRDYKTYTVSQEVAQTPDLNIALLPKGVGAAITDDGEITIFVPATGVANRVKDKDIATDMILGNSENTVVTIWKGEVWSLRTK